MDQQYFAYNAPTPPPPQRKRRRFTWVWFIFIALGSFGLGCLVMSTLHLSNQLADAVSTPPPGFRTPVPGGARNDPTATPGLTSDPNASATPRPAWQPASLTPFENATVPEINRRVSPSIVGITNSVRRLDRSEALSETAYSSGSGIIISEDGYIVTNSHVIQGASSIFVTLKGGEELPAVLIGEDSRTDIAVLKIDRSGLTPISMGDSDSVEVGEPAIAIGNPLGDLMGTLTMGVISGVNREMDIDGYKQTLLQTDAAINPGNSGGALVNSRGELIGINSMKSIFAGYDDYGNAIAAEGLGFAIPSNSAVPIIDILITQGKIERVGLGIYGHTITDAESVELSIPKGIYIVDVILDGPADEAGIMQGDVLLTFNDAELTDFNVLTSMLDSCKIGDVAHMDVWREGRTYVCDVQLAELTE